MTRIKYTNNDGILTNKNPIVAGRHNVKVTLVSEDLSYKIIDVDTGSVLSTGSASSLALVKKAAKDELRKLGAIFSDEVRSRSTGLETLEIPTNSYVE